MEKKKVLWHSDFNCATGFATVSQNIVSQLLKTGRYDFDVLAVNHFGEPYDFTRWPFPIYPAIDFAKGGTDKKYQDPFGRQRFLDLLSTGKYDIVFTLQDTFIIEPLASQISEAKKHLNFKWIFYFPIDGKPQASWINNALTADFPVTFTHFGKNETLKVNPAANPRVIYHGVNTKDFHPVGDIAAFRHTFFKEHAAKFIVTNVNRNQPRKDIPRTLAAFARFRQLRPDSFLYLHMRPDDVGGNLLDMAAYWDLEQNNHFMVPMDLDICKGYPIDVLNKIYNASDVVVSTTLGEGWGLTATEAMAAKVPLIIPDNTSFSEIGADGRARLVKCGKEFICFGANDASQYRPLTDIDDMVAALVDCHDNRGKYKEAAEKAYQWVIGLSWDNIVNQWAEIFELASGDISNKLGRNDKCPHCLKNGLDTKWKKCLLHNPEKQHPFYK
ncbi:MAG: glycosyltransferase [Negativicutes bacterium]|nr:glycosyltransferase [Negativicutes bacterium]